MTWATTKELYAIFVESCWWNTLSRRKRKSVGRCEECGSKKRLSSHHVRYPENWFETTFADLKVLCWPCHRKEHGFADNTENGQPIPKRAFVIPEPKPVQTLPNNPGRPIYMTFFTLTELEVARSRRRVTRAQFKEGAPDFRRLRRGCSVKDRAKTNQQTGPPARQAKRTQEAMAQWQAAEAEKAQGRSILPSSANRRQNALRVRAQKEVGQSRNILKLNFAGPSYVYSR